MRNPRLSLAAGLSLSLLLLCATAALQAQDLQFEYGKPAEMRGITKFFVDTQGDMKRREQIIDLIRKKLPLLTFSDSVDDAQALIVYTEEKSQHFAGGTSVDELTCKVYVAVPLSENRARLLFSYRTKKDNMFERAPYRNFAAEFVRAYKEANVDLSKNPYYRQMTGQDKKAPE